MRRLQDFLDTQHHIGEGRKRMYKVALHGFEHAGQHAFKVAEYEFEDVYLDSVKVHRVLNELSDKKSRVHIEDSTWNFWLVSYKRFARWLFDSEDEETPKLWRKIMPKSVDVEEKLKGKFFSGREFLDLLEATFNPCHRGMWAVGQSGALRAGELLGLRVGDVEVTGGEVRVTITGKTGTRSFPMNQFSSVLRRWLDFHPFKHDPNAPLWVREKEGVNGVYAGLRYGRVNQLIKYYAGLAGIKKDVSLHWLKHTKITWTARNRKIRVNDKQANAMFGWSPNSNMYRRYTHLHGTDTDDTFRALEGVESVAVKAQADVLARRKCFNCNEWNGAEAMYCFKCGCVLDEKAAKEQAENRKFMEWVFKQLREQGKLPNSL